MSDSVKLDEWLREVGVSGLSVLAGAICAGHEDLAAVCCLGERGVVAGEVPFSATLLTELRWVARTEHMHIPSR
jgi:hypothetical protein